MPNRMLNLRIDVSMGLSVLRMCAKPFAEEKSKTLEYSDGGVHGYLSNQPEAIHMARPG